VIIVLIYAISKVYHLPGLVLIMILGLFLGNLDQLGHIKWIHRLRPDVLEHEVMKLKELVIEGAFLIRSLFFLLFGFQIDTEALLDPDSLLWASGICALIFLIRYVFLNILRIPLRPLLFIAPRGLITILLFLSIPLERSFPTFSPSLVIQVVLISSLIMMIGTVLGNRNPKAVQIEDGQDLPLPEAEVEAEGEEENQK
jgi:cell volume regulation protein A